MLKHHAKHVLWLLALGTVVAHAAEVPVSSNYPVSQQQVHEQLHTAIEQAMDVRDKYQLEKARTWLSYADHEYSEKAKRQNIDLIYQQVLDIVYADQRATLSIETTNATVFPTDAPRFMDACHNHKNTDWISVCL